MTACLRFRQYQIKPPRRIRPKIPAITPPTIIPTFAPLLAFASVADRVGVWVLIDAEVVTCPLGAVTTMICVTVVGCPRDCEGPGVGVGVLGLRSCVGELRGVVVVVVLVWVTSVVSSQGA